MIDGKAKRNGTSSYCFFGAIVLATAYLLTGSATAQSRRIYIANDDHTDFLWTADEQTYERVFQEMIDFYVDLAEKTDANPAPYQEDGHPYKEITLWGWLRHLRALADEDP